MKLILMLFLSLVTVTCFAQGQSSEPLVDKCVCPPARCDQECQDQKGVFFFTPICKDGKKLSCAQAKCLPKSPQPQVCIDRKNAILDAARAKKASLKKDLDSKQHGVFVVAIGDTDIIHKDGIREKAKIGSKIYPGEIIETGKDGKARIMFTDNNVTSVVADTHLELVQYQNNSEDGAKDVLFNLTKGQVRNSVNQKYDGVKQNFRIKTPSAVAGVRGTEFLVAYSSEIGEAKVTTFKGEVEFGKTVSQNGTILDGISVKVGQAATITRDTIKPEGAFTLSETEFARIDSESQVGPLAMGEVPLSQPQVLKKQERKPASALDPVCLSPDAQLYDCHWSSEHGKCARKRCFADGVWRFESFEQDQGMCEGQGLVGHCQ